MEKANFNSNNAGITQGAFAEKLEGFRKQVQGHIITEKDQEYDSVRKIWNGMIDKRPLAIVKCTSTDDVINTVNFIRENNLQLSVRAGGHNAAGNSLCDGGVVIDLSLMKQIEFDPEQRI